ncbi:hypothetical protein WS62_24510 [Burkholderia sp. ABCPW 14]|uniref:STY0301 family protein n=1 Tax=Burkholderia sp. ABCPW 14 TaxID=1637860 RepID=UPI000770E46D|nr:STY0301 family protein [Burkholderia sp. ABCPW 14]KVD81742.1 hypothetical protein WS62_24510 [Burkholderia sp. ABCPW 14]
MSWSKAAGVLLAMSFYGCASASGTAAEVCPARAESPLRYVDVFDGAPSEMATLVPDEGGERKGNWQLGYVYDAGRYVTVRCKYADGRTTDVKLADRVNRCDYRIDGQKTLKLMCE